MLNHYTIFGGPGTGKTTAMIGRIAKAVEETLYGGDVIICSMTRTAAKEIADRVKLGVPGVEFPHVGTVHALAMRALKAIDRSPQLVYDEDRIKDFNTSYGRHLPVQLGNMLYDPEGSNYDLMLLADIDRRRAAEHPTNDWPPRTLRLYNQWETWKSSHALMDFTDLILAATRLCNVHPANPRYIFVDEAQDLSRLEMRLINQWSLTTEKTIVAGDDQQALYEWRGASVKDFIKFAPEGNTYVLPHGHRMTRPIHNEALDLGWKIRLRVDKEFTPADGDGEVTKMRSDSVIRAIKNDIADDRSVMLLASCGYMLNPYLKELRKAGVPFHNPYRSRSEGKTWNPIASQQADSFRLFLAPVTGRPMWTWAQLYKIVTRMQPDVTFSKIVNAYRNSKDIVPNDVMDEHCPKDFLAAAESGDYNWYFNHLKADQRVGAKGSLSPMGYLRRVLDNHGIPGLMSRPKLIVGTIHSVKGGEADCVYLLPHLSPQAHKHMSQSATGRDSVLRTFYVGVSRAKSKLVYVTDPTERRVMWR